MSAVASRGTNLVQLGTFNQTVVLHAIRRSDGISRVELGQVTGLAGQTVTNICRRLLDEGLITEGRKTAGGPGKPRTRLHINGPARVAVGVHLDPAVTTITMLDLAGRTITADTFDTPSAVDPTSVVATIAEAVNRMITASGVDRQLILGLGIAAPGPVDLVRGVVDNPPHLPGWRQVPLRDSLAAATGLAVLLDKDVSAAAVAEAWAGTVDGAATSAVLYLGTGIGVGLIVDGQVVRGSSGNAGELRHVIIDPEGPPCSCGRRGCVDVTITSQALVSQAVEHGLFPDGGPEAQLGRVLERLYDLADEGVPAALSIIENAAVGFARTALVVTNLLDVDRLVLGGPYWSRMAPHFFAVAPPLLEAGAAAHRIHAVELVGTRLGSHLGAIGAASLVLDDWFSPHATSLVLTS
jgi:predicted NBD/HSP70 family sugar kinase